MSEILLRADDARSAARDMRSKAQAAQDQFTATRNRLTELSSSFKGRTADSFAEKFDEWHSSATKLLDALNGLSEFLDGAANAIEETDTTIANKLKG